MGKGGSSAPTEQNITQTSLPDYYEPYALRLMDRAEGLSLGGYQPYGGQRTADISSDTGAAYDLTRQVAGAGVPGLDTAFDVTQQNMQAGQNLANVQPYQFGPSQFQMSGANPYMGFQAGQADPYAGFQGTQFDQFGGFQAGQADPYAGFQGTQFDQFGGFQAGQADPYANFREAQFDPYSGFQSAAGDASPYDLGAERQFTGQEVQQYMDPYLENVVDVQKKRRRTTSVPKPADQRMPCRQALLAVPAPLSKKGSQSPRCWIVWPVLTQKVAPRRSAKPPHSLAKTVLPSNHSARLKRPKWPVRKV